MKTILAILLAVGSFAQARGQENEGVFLVTYDPQKIYGALKVTATALNPGMMGVSRTEKSVGGLSCIRSLIIVPEAQPTYSCQIDASAPQDFEAIYKSLAVKEVALNPGFSGAYRKQKSVGGLTCIKSRLVVPGSQVEYECQIEE